MTEDATALPVVLIISNGLFGWKQFREGLEGFARVVHADISRLDLDLGEAFKNGPPAVIGMGCVANGSEEPATVFVGLPEKLRNKGGYKGLILGLCEACPAQHMEIGCDEVVQFGRPAAERILQILRESSSAPT